MGDVQQERGRLWLPARKLGSLTAAGKFVGKVGFALLFPAEKIMVPSLYEATAGPDAIPFQLGMGDPESKVWQWKDELPDAGLAWSGKLIHKRSSLLSPELLGLLYEGDGEPEDHRSFQLMPEAHRIADALAGGPLPTSALREIVGDRSRYDRAITQLQTHLLVSSAGTHEQRAGWPAVLMDLTCRLFDVGQAPSRAVAAQRFLATLVQATPVQLAKTFGWTTADARSELDKLVAVGQAKLDSGNYRNAGVK